MENFEAKEYIEKKNCKESHKSKKTSKGKHCSHKTSHSSDSSVISEHKHIHVIHKHKYDSDSSSSDTSKSSSKSSKSSKSSHSSHCSPKHLHKLIKMIKHKMIHDKTIMPFGSDAYAHIYQNGPQTILPGASVYFDMNHILYNIDHCSATDLGSIEGSGNVIVRKDGIYIVIFGVNTNEACQFTIFLNGKPLEHTTVGKNSGAGQILIKTLLPLHENDVLNLRNYTSNSQAVTISLDTVGLSPRIGAFVNIVKIGSLQQGQHDECIMDYEKMKHKYCFEYILEKLKCEHIFDFNMSDAYGEAFSITTQNIAQEGPVIFEQGDLFSKIDFVPGTCDLIIRESGLYITEFMASTIQPSQFTMFINGVPEDTSTITINKGGAQMVMRELSYFKNGDVISVRNHTSNVGAVDLSVNPGGLAQSTNNKILLTRVGPIPCKPNKDDCKDRHEHCSEKFEKIYNAFIHFLYINPKISIKGINAYGAALNQNHQMVQVDKAIKFALNSDLKQLCVYHKTGDDEFHIFKDGVYKVFYTDSSDQPIQVAFTVNGNLLSGGIAGVNTGAGAVSLRKFISLHCGDVVKVINHISTAGTITLNENAGGSEVAINSEFMLYRIDALPCVPPPPPQKKK